MFEKIGAREILKFKKKKKGNKKEKRPRKIDSIGSLGRFLCMQKKKKRWACQQEMGKPHL
jgi:hypothetical protein